MRADNLISLLSILFQKHYMAPRRRAKVASVVVGISRPRETVIRHVIPFFARDFASFAANANGRVSEEADLYFLLYKIVMALVGAFCAFADHGLCARTLLWFGERMRFACRSRRHRRQKSLLILFLLWRDPRRWTVRRVVLRDAESSGLLVAHIYLETRRTRVRVANGPAQCYKCMPWLP